MAGKANNVLFMVRPYLVLPLSVDSQLWAERHWRLTVRPNQSHGCDGMQLETRFLRLSKPLELGEQIDGWRVCWLGGWDKNRIFYMVMVVREKGADRPTKLHFRCLS